MINSSLILRHGDRFNDNIVAFGERFSGHFSKKKRLADSDILALIWLSLCLHSSGRLESLSAQHIAFLSCVACINDNQTMKEIEKERI